MLLLFLLLLFLCFVSLVITQALTLRPASLNRELGIESSSSNLSSHRSLILQFDGCFRPPRDPGYPTIPRRLAVCSACIGFFLTSDNNKPIIRNNESDETNDDEVDLDVTMGMYQPLAVGAKLLDVPIGMTSQHAEYEGLILGLEWLCSYLHCDGKNDNGDVGHDSRGTVQSPYRYAGHPASHPVSITVQGDCKTVIDQLSGKAVPRKLQRLHQRAQNLLSCLATALQQINSSTYTRGKSPTNQIQYQHIPRMQNSISDNICNNLFTVVEYQTWKACISDLDRAYVDQLNFKSLTPSTPNLSSGRKATLHRVFDKYLGFTSSIIKYSIRPHLYEQWAEMAAELAAFDFLVSVGQRMVEESSYHHPKCKSTALVKRGVEIQILGWKRLEEDKKIMSLQRKYDWLLRGKTKIGDSGAGTGNVRDQIFSLGNSRFGMYKWDTETIPRQWITLMLHEWLLDAEAAEWKQGGDPLWVSRIMHSDRTDS